MATTLPGTKIEVSDIKKGVSRQMFDGIFAAGGITLSQVSIMTGLEPYMIQNWVKRKFVSSPVKRVYSKNQFARIVIINMLRETLNIDRICSLLEYINGTLNDESDDRIGDNELYHIYIDMIATNNKIGIDKAYVEKAALKAAESFVEAEPGDRKRLVKILQTMAHAHYASISLALAQQTMSELN